jgi:hypothetical protein
MYFPEMLLVFSNSDILHLLEPLIRPYLQLPYIHPPLAVLFIIFTIDSKFGWAKNFDKYVRRSLQYLGSVSRYVRQLIRRLKRAEIKPAAYIEIPNLGSRVFDAEGSLPAAALDSNQAFSRVVYLTEAIAYILRSGHPDGPQRFLSDHRPLFVSIREQVRILQVDKRNLSEPHPSSLDSIYAQIAVRRFLPNWRTLPQYGPSRNVDWRLVGLPLRALLRAVGVRNRDDLHLYAS